MLDYNDKLDDVATDRDVTLLAQRFVAETSDFLTRNWDVRRQWWPRRHGGVGAATALNAEAATVSAAPSPEVPIATPVPSPRMNGPHSDGAEFDDLYLFILTPRTHDVELLAARIRAALARGPADDDAEEWQVWMPETLCRHGRAIPSNQIRLDAARDAAGIH